MDPSNNEVRKYKDEIIKIIKRAKYLLKSNCNKLVEASIKADGSYVTDADLDVEKLIRLLIKKSFPEHGIIGEELEEVNSESDIKWLIDPIDGTKSFVHGIPLFGIVVSLLYKDKPILGLIDLVCLNSYYIASIGDGLYYNGKKIKLSDIPTYSAASDEIIAVGDRSQFIKANETIFFDNLFKTQQTIRTYTDCFGHAMALQGSIGAMIDFHTRLWDIKATELLITEAGGKFVILREYKCNDNQLCYDIIFGKPTVVDWLIERFHETSVNELTIHSTTDAVTARDS